MDISFTFSDYENLTFVSLFLTLMFPLLCSFLLLFPFIILVFSQSNKNKACKCARFSCNGSDLMAATGTAMARMINGVGEVVMVERERQQMVGASMMEQLVPEITTHVLSYLDYRSLCSLSMTNSSMRRAANDDNAWKTLYHKMPPFMVASPRVSLFFVDSVAPSHYHVSLFLTRLHCYIKKGRGTQQNGIRPANGWKSYYADTKAIVNINQRFFDLIRERSLVEMGRLWLNADYVKCVHASGDIFTGYNRVIRSWQLAFNWELGIDFQIQDVSARVMTDMAWVTMKAYIAMDQSGLNLTNVFEFHNGQWYLVHHHSSEMLFNDGELPPLLA